ncbi:hypothetical protein QR685DRAFT_453241 [Neurospora intermedia]|uniref:Uncharacterized protein n=1 Tax=Neurospora intermedia TaxID=5142 RepID=A0ABR3CY89_NEUIN
MIVTKCSVHSTIKYKGGGDRIILPIHNDDTYRTLCYFNENIRSCNLVKNDGVRCCLLEQTAERRSPLLLKFIRVSRNYLAKCP